MPASARKSLSGGPKENVAPSGKSLYYKNLGLFSDPFLDQLNDSKVKHSPLVLRSWETEALPDFSASYEWMLDTWAQLKDILPTKSEAQLEEMWIRPIFKLLGWEFEVQSRLKKWGKTEIPDYSLFVSRQAFLKAQKCKTDDAYFENVSAVADAKQMGISLDGSKMDNSNPSYQIINYLNVTGREWGILTDGRYWRLYSTRARSKYSSYYEINIEKFLNDRDDQQFKYFFNFFRKEAFAKDATSAQSFLDIVFENGERYAREVEDKLKDRAFHLVELISQGFSEGRGELNEDELREVYTHSLYYLFRLMFILNCEAKGLLNVHKQSDYYTSSLRALCSKVKQEYEADQPWSNRFLSYRYVDELFELLKAGDAKIGIHGFGREVFSSGDANFYKKHQLSDSFLNKVLVELAFAEDKKEKSLLFIDYKRLAADHLGSLFEGLLEFRLEQPKSGKSKAPLLVNSSGERKATGSYYTPQYIVDYIVAETLAPLVKGKSVDQILKIKVMDPAMGSGHFLLGAVRYLEDAILTRISTEQDSDIEPQMVQWEVLHSCIYGVDINPLAAELAKFSLWMSTARTGYELEPLADQLVCCDSLLDSVKWNAAFSKEAKLGGFDAVIGNPPYVRQEYLSSRKEELESRFEIYHSMADLYAYFIEKGISVLRDGGRFGMIIANKWMRAEYGKALRSWLKTQGIEAIIDFGDLPVFPGVAAYPVILLVEKNKKGRSLSASPVTMLDAKNLSHHIQEVAFDVKLTELDDNGWTFKNPDQQRLYSRLAEGAIPLSEYVDGNAFYGIKTGLTPAFVIDEAVKKKIVKEDRGSAALLKPFVLGRDVKRYAHLAAKKYLIFIPKGWTNKQNTSKQAPWDWFRKNYPGVAEHLVQFKSQAEKRSDKGDYWWEIRACDYYDKFESPKISYVRFQVKPAFTIDSSGQYTNDAIWAFESTDKYLLAFLNSKIGWFLISQHCTQIQGGYQLIWKNLSRVPILRPEKFSKSKIQQLSNLVDETIKERAKGENPGVHGQSSTELKIDDRLYELFELSKQEIAAVEKHWSLNTKSKAESDDSEEDEGSIAA